MRGRVVLLTFLTIGEIGNLWSFESNIPTRAVHEEITAAAALKLGFSGACATELRSAVGKPDRDENAVIPSPGRPLPGEWPVPNSNYRAEHHFDRSSGVSTTEAFERSARYVRERRAEALRLAVEGNGREARAKLGLALHALQDFYAHSNYVDLSRAQQEAVQNALWRDGAEVPPDLKLTAYDPKAVDPAHPDDSVVRYTHADNAKDAPDPTNTLAPLSISQRKALLDRKLALLSELARASSEYQKQRIKAEMAEITARLQAASGEVSTDRTAFTAARTVATDASELLLRQMKSGLDVAAWKKLTTDCR